MLRTLISLALVCFLLPTAPWLPAVAAAGVVAAPGYFPFTYASGVPNPTAMVFGDSGELYVSTLGGSVLVFRDLNGDGVSDQTSTFQGGFTLPLGLEWQGGSLYVSSLGIVTKVTDTDADFIADTVDTLIAGLPFGLHQNSGLAFGPAGNLYVTVGSISEDANQPPLAASILQYSPTGTFLSVWATGIRNAYDILFTQFGFFYASDNSPSADSTNMCFEAPDELNLIFGGNFYGFPHCFGSGDCADLSAYCTPAPCGLGDCEFGPGCSGTSLPAVLLDPHSAPTGMTLGDGFNGFDQNDLFLCLFGQGVPVPGCVTDFGHKVVRIPLSGIGLPTGQSTPQDFLTGLQNPTGIAVGPDGALYVADFGTGIIHRVVQTQPGAAPDGDLPRITLRLGPNPARHFVDIHREDDAAPGGPIRVFDLTGRLVTEIPWSGGSATARWNLTNDRGRRVGAGVYVIRAVVGRSVATRKLLVLD